MSELRVIHAKGAPLARGQQIGRELADLIQVSIEFYHRYLERRGVSSTRLQDLLTPYLVAAETRYPEQMEVLKGMSAGAFVPVLELFAINAFEELEPLLESPEGELLFLQKKEGYLRPPKPPLVERCSSLTARTADGRLLFAHNEHWLAGDIGNVAVVIDEPVGGRAAVASPTIVCCLPAVGTNTHGAMQGIGSLTASDDNVRGVPRVLVSRDALEARDRPDAISRAASDGRAGGYGHVFGFPGGDAFTIETTATRHHVMEGPGPHTNHYLDPELAALAPEASEGSRSRHARLSALLEEHPPEGPEDLMVMMRDHRSATQAICLHPDPADGEEASAVVFSVVGDVDARRMWVASGNPCEHPYEEIDLSAVRC
jgi:isopenicillin-N N-acyltransferase-like protein